jgi:hypothetical protein
VASWCSPARTTGPSSTRDSNKSGHHGRGAEAVPEQVDGLAALRRLLQELDPITNTMRSTMFAFRSDTLRMTSRWQV